MSRLTPKIYAFALDRILDRAPDNQVEQAVRAWLDAMRARGDITHARRAVREFEKIAHRRGKWATFRVQIARPKDEEAVRALILGTVPQKDAPLIRVSVNPAVIAGARIIRNDSLLVDASLKGMLDGMFGEHPEKVPILRGGTAMEDKQSEK
ncbi:MAG: F0F1 ATP synthase subunit delta [Patescibacteria group bacterium]